MKLIDPRKYFFPNLLSWIGWLLFIIIPIPVYIFSKPINAVISYLLKVFEIKNPDLPYVVIAEVLGALAFALCVLLFIIEFFIRKRNKSEFPFFNSLPDRYKIPYTFVFWIGIFCSIPFEGVFFIYLVKIMVSH